MTAALGISLGWLLVRINWIIRLVVVPTLIVAALCLLDIGWSSFYGPAGIVEGLDVLSLATTYVACVAFVWWVIGIHGIYDWLIVRKRRKLDE